MKPIPAIVLSSFDVRRIRVIAKGHGPVPVLIESPALDTAEAVAISIDRQ